MLATEKVLVELGNLLLKFCFLLARTGQSFIPLPEAVSEPQPLS